MANEKHLKRLLQGVEEWNRWRKENFKTNPDLSYANLKSANLSGANLKSANLSGAILNSVNLTDANLTEANLSGASLYKTKLKRTVLYKANLNGADLKGADLKDADLSYANLSDTNFNVANLLNAKLIRANLFSANLLGANLLGANLLGANLSSVNLRGFDLSGLNLSGIDFSGFDLRKVQARGTNFRGATLTGACIEDWHINSETDLQDVVCEYIFIGWDENNQTFAERRPHNPKQTFAPGEFAVLVQAALETVDLIFLDGIDWRAFFSSIKDLQDQYDSLNIQAIERRSSGAFVVRLEVPLDTDKGLIERTIKEDYGTKRTELEAYYQNELHLKSSQIERYRQENTNLWDVVKLQASKPINMENQVVVENQGHSETFNNYMQGATIGNFANTMKDQSSQHATQYIGATLNEITTLIHSLQGIAQSFPEAQRTEALDHLKDLEADIQQPPEKRKVNRMKAALLTLLGLATALSGAVAGTNEFVGQLQELSDKLGIPLPIEQVQTQEPPPDAIEVKAVGSEKP